MRFGLPSGLAMLLLLLLVGLPALVLHRLELNNAPEVYFPADSPAVRLEAELRGSFPSDQVLVVLLEGAGLFEDPALDAMAAVAQALQARPNVDRVLSLPTLDHIRGTADGFVVEPLLDPHVAQEMGREARRARVLEDRFAPGLLVSESGAAVALVVRPVPLENSLQRLDLQRATLAALEAHGLTSRVRAVGGQVALDVAQLRAMVHDTVWFVPLTTALGLAIIGWLFRRWLAVLLTAATIGAVNGSSLAILVLAGHPFSLIAAILPPLMTALSVAFLIHWFNALTGAARSGLTGEARVTRALAEVRRPALFTALTTSAGLASLGLSPIQPIAAFGLTAATGMAVLAVVVLLLLPPITVRLDRGEWVARRGGIRRLDRVVAAIGAVGIRRPLPVITAFLLLALLALPWIPRVEVETDLFRFFSADHPITRSNQRIQEQLSGVTTLEVVLDGAGRDTLKKPERLQAIGTLHHWLERMPEVDRVTSMVELVEEMHWAFHGEDPAYRTLPERRDLIAQYLFIYDGVDLYELVNREFDRTRLLLNLNVHGAGAINRVISAIEAEAAAHPLPELSLRVGGAGRLFGDQERLLIQGQVRGLLAAALLIALLLALLWRSAGAALLCMVPNLAPVAALFSIMGLFGIWLDMATAMIASVTVGIAVDDTIHLYHGYRQRRGRGASPVWALARTYRGAGRAITATTLVLCAQFLLLTGSDFMPTAEFGLLTSVGLLTALLFDLLLLPAILMVVTRHRVRGNTAK